MIKGLADKSREIVVCSVIVAISIGAAILLRYIDRRKRVCVFFRDVIFDELTDVKAALKKDPSLIRAKDPNGSTPLHFAESEEMEKLLIECGADINVKNRNGFPPSVRKSVKALFEDVKTNQIADVRLALEKDPSLVRAKDLNNAIPLHYPISEDMAKLLIDFGSDVNSRDNEGLTPLSQAVWKDNAGIAGLLILNGADVKTKDNDMFTLLHVVSSKKMAQLFISKGLDINAKASKGHTPLHSIFAFHRLYSFDPFIREKEESFIELVEYLVSEGADVNAKSKLGETPLWLHLKHAKEYKLSEKTARAIEEILRRHGGRE